MFRDTYNKFYKGFEELTPYYWLPKWCGDVKEASARVLNCYDNSANLAEELGGTVENQKTKLPNDTSKPNVIEAYLTNNTYLSGNKPGLYDAEVFT
jgi:hypothetical protein